MPRRKPIIVGTEPPPKPPPFVVLRLEAGENPDPHSRQRKRYRAIVTSTTEIGAPYHYAAWCATRVDAATAGRRLAERLAAGGGVA